MKFERVITTGNVLTILGGLCVVFGVFVSNQVADAKRDEQMAALEKKVAENAIVKEDLTKVKVAIGKMQANQENHDKMLTRIIDHLERRQ